MGLQQKQVDIQQDQVNFNKQMWLANTIINATQAAAGMTRAAAGLGQAIGDYHDQQANLAIQTASTAYQAGVTEAVTNGYDPYVIETLEDGKQVRRYIGYDGYRLQDGKTLGEIKQEAVKTVGEKYWTNSGAERGSQIAVNAFENIELAAQRQTADAVIKNRQNVFNQELTNAISSYQRTGDPAQINQVLEGATWLTEDQKQAITLETSRTAHYGNVQDNALNTARTQGMSETQRYIDGITDLTAEEKAKILSEAQRVSNQDMAVAKADAADTYTKTDGTIRAKYDAAIRQGNQNPETLEARKSAARQKQIYDLSERFSQETNGANLAQLETLQARYKDGGTYDADYLEQEQLQKEHYIEITRRIEAIKAEQSKKSPESNIMLDTIREAFLQWQKGNGDGRVVYRMIEGAITDIPISERRQMESALISGNDGTGTEAARQFERLDAVLAANAPDKKKASPAEIDAYTQYTQQIKDTIMEARFRGVAGESLKKEVDRVLEVETSKVLREAVTKGTIGSTGLFGGAPGVAKEYLWFANQGKLDAYFGERSTQEMEFDKQGNVTTGTRPHTVGGEKMETVASQVNAFGKDYLNGKLQDAKITVSDGEMMPGTKDNRGGDFRYKGSDGKWYRLGVDRRNGGFIIERNTGDRWEKIDVRNLPEYKAERQKSMGKWDMPEVLRGRF